MEGSKKEISLVDIVKSKDRTWSKDELRAAGLQLEEMNGNMFSYLMGNTKVLLEGTGGRPKELRYVNSYQRRYIPMGSA